MDADNVTFSPFNMYSSDATEKTDIINLVVSQAPAGAVRATVVNGWHTSRNDKRNHCTVDYYDAAGAKISRNHVV
ncbi:hypothetical protein MANI_022526 [Metarhizium anisopliae]